MFFYETLNLKPTMELFILISLIQEIWLAEPETYGIPFTMVQWWKRDSTMMKTRGSDGENTMIRNWNNDFPWWNNDGTLVKQRMNNDENVMVRWWKHDVTMVKIRWYDGETVMAWWWKRGIILTSATSHHRDFTIVLSLFHHRSIVLSPLYHRI
jgi:hypothetical protein